MERLHAWFRRVIWAGIIVNMLFVIPLCFAPEFLFNLLGMQLTQPILARVSGMLLFIISVFYIPAAWDVNRYRANAWLHCFPSRFLGSTFCFVAVFGFDYELGYLSMAIVDAVFLFLALIIMTKITRREGEHGKPVSMQ